MFMPVQISVIVPVYNAAQYLRACLRNLSLSTVPPYECIVVDDGSTDESVQVAKEFGAIVVSTEGRSGPARARNMGARHAKGNILYFIDSDVCVYPDTIERVQTHFEADPALDGLIGSYDDAPKQKDFLSQYKNLMHCFVHHNARREACTFWSGCGAIRRDIFFAHSGFDESYDRPAIEDIELGYRLVRAHRKLILDAGVRVKHLKVWSFFGLLKTDILDRGVPWTELIIRDRRLPNDLNLHLSHRVSMALMFLLVGTATVGAVIMGASLVAPLLALLFLVLVRYEVEGAPNLRFKSMIGTVILGAAIGALAAASDKMVLVPPVLFAYLLMFLNHRYSRGPRWRAVFSLICGSYLVMTMVFVVAFLPRSPLVWALFAMLSVVIFLNSGFYLFLASKRGRLFALAAIPFHLLFHFYNGISFIIGLTRYSWRALFDLDKRSVPASLKK
jgi:glycosyltransferase involved in cell wall biosynthesis